MCSAAPQATPVVAGEITTGGPGGYFQVSAVL
jgi:hypothetical protein